MLRIPKPGMGLALTLAWYPDHLWNIGRDPGAQKRGSESEHLVIPILFSDSCLCINLILIYLLIQVCSANSITWCTDSNSLSLHILAICAPQLF